MTKKQMDIDVSELLVRQVSELVRGTADYIHERDPSWDILKLEEQLYRVLAVNCEAKAKIAKSFSETGKALAKEGKAKRDKMETQTTK